MDCVLALRFLEKGGERALALESTLLCEVIVEYQAEPVLPGKTLEVSFMNES